MVNEHKQLVPIQVPGVAGDFHILPIFQTEAQALLCKESLRMIEPVTIEEVDVRITQLL
jgi:hypothetical protein